MSLLSRYTTQDSEGKLSHTFSCAGCLDLHIALLFIFFSSICLQIYSTKDLEDNLNKIREVCSDDKHDWDQRANAVSSVFFPLQLICKTQIVLSEFLFVSL